MLARVTAPPSGRGLVQDLFREPFHPPCLGAGARQLSSYFTTDLRLRYAISRQWHAALGIDNLNNDKYWNFHPYPQRTYSAELQFDL